MVSQYKTQYKYQNEDTQSPYCGNAAKCQNVLAMTHTVQRMGNASSITMVQSINNIHQPLED